MTDTGYSHSSELLKERVRRLHRLCVWSLFFGDWTASLLSAMVLSGTVILCFRALGLMPFWWMVPVISALPVSFVYPCWRIRKFRFSAGDAAAWLDCHGHNGGMLMASLELPDLRIWGEKLDRLSVPHPKWRVSRHLPSLFAALAFPLLCALAPLPRPEPQVQAPRLDISTPAALLTKQLDTLNSTGALSEGRHEELSRTLRELGENTAAMDPGKIYESLDAMEALLRQVGNDAARHMVRAARTMQELELAAMRLETAPDEDIERRLRQRAMQLSRELASVEVLNDLRLQGGISHKEAISQFLENSPPISREQLRQLAEQLRECRGKMGGIMKQLQDANCTRDMEQLRAFLDKHGRLCATAGSGGEMWLTKAQEKALFGESPGFDGISRGRGDAPMFFGSESPALANRLKSEKLNTDALRMDFNETLGISFAAPEISPVDDGGQGQLATNPGSGGQARKMRIPPANRELVKRYFSENSNP